MADNLVVHTGYTYYDLLNTILGASEPDSVQANSTEYIELLTTVRTKISEEHTNTLNGILTNPNAYNVLMPIILSYVTDYVNNTNDITININRTAERIFQDMAGFGILTPYLKDPTVEEININAWNAIEILWSDRQQLLEETFASPQECVDIIRKMVRIGGVHIDYSQPIIDSFIGDGTRISATLPPVNADITGATASIRKQTYKNVTREKYLSLGFATPKVFDFIDMGVKHNISVGLAGSPGAGKTTFMTCLLRRFQEDKKGNNRICTIEEAREIDLSVTEDMNPGGGHPRMTSRVLQFNTTQGEHPVTARKLIRHALRVNPQIIVPAEMRGEEAVEAVEAGLTGVQIVSSFHAWGAKDGYIRIQSMCQMGHGSTSESALLQMIIRAFPLMVFIKKDDDGVRRVHEVFEATGVEEGRVVGNTIFRYVRTKVYENEDGRIVKLEGVFLQQDSISKNLRRLLIQNGARKEMVDRYYFEGENPEHPEQYDEGHVEVVTIMSGEDLSSKNEPKAPATEEIAPTAKAVEPAKEDIKEEIPNVIPSVEESVTTEQPSPQGNKPEPEAVESVIPEQPISNVTAGGISFDMTPPPKETAQQAEIDDLDEDPFNRPGSQIQKPQIERNVEPAQQVQPQPTETSQPQKPKSRGFWGGLNERRGR